MGICVRGCRKPISVGARHRNPLVFSCFCTEFIKIPEIRRGACGVCIKTIGITTLMIFEHPDRLSIDGFFQTTNKERKERT